MTLSVRRTSFRMVESKAFMFFAVGVDGARMEVLRDLSVRQPLKLRDLDSINCFNGCLRR